MPVKLLADHITVIFVADLAFCGQRFTDFSLVLIAPGSPPHKFLPAQLPQPVLNIRHICLNDSEAIESALLTMPTSSWLHPLQYHTTRTAVTA
jgi:hypothetical protein